MKTHLYTTHILLMALLLQVAGCATYVGTPIWELRDSRLEYVALPRLGRGNSITIIYNPDICERIGEACGFFLSHAFAHDVLEHQIFTDPRFYVQRVEDEADCWAGKYGRPNEVTAAVYFLLDESKHEGIKITGDPKARAELIKNCAIENDRWLGD